MIGEAKDSFFTPIDKEEIPQNLISLSKLVILPLVEKWLLPVFCLEKFFLFGQSQSRRFSLAGLWIRWWMSSMHSFEFLDFGFLIIS